MQEKNKGNLKSEKSKMWIENSLLMLMESEVFNEITIQEIVDHAGLSRRTFYRNYYSKEDIIRERFDKIWKEYEAMVIAQDNLSLPNVTRVFFTIMNKHLDFLLIINQHNLLPILAVQVDELLPPIFKKLKGDKMNLKDETISYALLFGTGGLLRILIKWLNDKNRKTPEEMAFMMNRIMKIIDYPIDSMESAVE